MERVYEAIKLREMELRGHFAGDKDIETLDRLLTGLNQKALIQIYLDFPICGATVSFSVAVDGAIGLYAPDSGAEYDSDRDHEFYWMPVRHVIEELENAFLGPAVLRAGFVPIGHCCMGGDGYFVNLSEDSAGDPRLYRLYYDWVDPNAQDPVPKEAINLVASSLASVMRRCRLEPGLPPP